MVASYKEDIADIEAGDKYGNNIVDLYNPLNYISAWVNYEDVSDVSIALSDIAAYRTKGASKAIPGFDVIDYGQEDYVFGDSEQDARHWNKYLLEIFEEYADVLAPLFNK